MIRSAMQAFLDRKILSVDGMKYNSWRVERVSPPGDRPDMRKCRAPDIVIGLQSAADIEVVVGMGWEGFRPSL